MRLVERTLPVGFIAIEAESNLSRTPQAALEGVNQADVRDDLLAMLSALPEEPESRERAVRALSGVEPFNRFPELLAEIAGQASPDGGGQ